MTFWVAIIAVIVIMIFVTACVMINLLTAINRNLQKTIENDNILYQKLVDVEKNTAHKGSVTDPFQAANKSHTVGATSKHIVVRKTPDQIRAENAEAIKNGGKSYGSPV